MDDAGRLPLDAHWELASAPDAGDWRAIGAPRPVAAVLAEAGEWSLDGPARRFDAERWCYRLRLATPAGVAEAGARLVFEGLATCCDVSFNGTAVLVARNMFRRHVVELPPEAWRADGNELLLQFEPLDAHLAARRPRPRWRTPMVDHQQLRFVRTTLLGRTPGWSPAAALVGPWRGIHLERLDVAVPEIVDQRAWIDAEGDPGTGTGRLRLSVRLPGGPALVAAVLQPVDDTDPREIVATLERDADGLYRGELAVPAVRRWWPHTHGIPARYALALRVLPLASASSRKQPFDIRRATIHPRGHVGFRAVAIDRGADGEGFALRVNDVPVFARGLCWVPLDTLRLDASSASLRATLRTLCAAGVNMIRVGGTMAYENAAFFDACDEAGVMVWQEFMFASMDYPASDPVFAAEVRAEAAQQLALWQAHPCVAVVCGNSEVAQQAAMWGADRDAWAPPLFHETLAAQTAAALPDVPYWPSSACGGAFPFQPSAGTTSYYGVGAYLRPVEDARHAGLRFATECLAFAQVPDDSALARLAALQDGMPVRTHQPLWKERVPRDLGAGWDFDDVRDHYLETQFGLAAAEARRGDLPTYWALSRAASAEVMAAAYQQWRDPANPCGGAFVWFLRDLRAGAGWGVLDEQGHPKAAFHALARVWQPLHVGLVDEGQNGVFVHVVNERPGLFEGTLSLVFHSRGEVQVGRVDRPVALAPRAALRESALAHAHGFMDLNGSYRFGPAAADLVVATLRDADGVLLGETFCFLRPVGAMTPVARRDLGLQARARRLGDADGRVRVTLTSRAAARGVHFEAPGWRADDEYFALAPGATREVDFLPVRSAVATTAGASAHPVASAAATPLTWYARATAINADGWAPIALEDVA